MPEVNNLIVKSYDLLFLGIVMKRYTGAIAILPSQQGVRSEFSSIIRYIHDNCKSVTAAGDSGAFFAERGIPEPLIFTPRRGRPSVSLCASLK